MPERLVASSAEQPVLEERMLSDWAERYQRLSYILSGEPNLGQCMQKVTQAHTDEILAVQYGPKPERLMKPTIIDIEGLPGSGKTRLAGEVMRYLGAYSGRMEATHGTPIKRHLLHWDAIEEEVQTRAFKAAIEQKATEQGSHQKDYQRISNKLQAIPHPEPGKPYSDRFLRMVNDVLCLRLAELIGRNEPNTMIVIDKPGGTGIKRQGEWIIKRPYGIEDIDNLTNSHGVFLEIPRTAYRLATIGLVASPWQRLGMAMYRTKLNDSGTDFAEARKLNAIYGQEPFSTEEAFHQAKGGGSDKQINKAYEKARATIGEVLEERVWISSYVASLLAKNKMPQPVPENDLGAAEMVDIAETMEAVFGIPKAETLVQGAISTGVGVIFENTFGIGAGARIKEDSFLTFLQNKEAQPDFAAIVSNSPKPHYMFAGVLQR